MKNRISNFGFSTLLICFTMICILIFSVLALITANSDYRLSKKVAEKNTTYYEAEEQAYDIIEQLDSKLYNSYIASSSEEEYYVLLENNLTELDGTFDGNMFYISLPLSENQKLDIALEITYPVSSTDNFYRISSWKNTTDTSVDDEKILDLLD